ncbi:MAG: DUF1678 family protein [Thermoguttaceae bacterium]
MENPIATDRCDHPALRLIAARPEVFCRRGHVSAGYRHENGKTYGPYFRLGYRIGGRQRTLYLGRSAALVEKVRQALAAIQKPLAIRRLLDQFERQLRASLRLQKRRTNALLRPFGLWLKGSEVRGWRHSRLRPFLPRCFSLRRLLQFRSSTPHTVIRKRKPNRNPDPPAARLMKFLRARDGPQALDGDAGRSCIMPNPGGGPNDDFAASLMGFGPGWKGLATAVSTP